MSSLPNEVPADPILQDAKENLPKSPNDVKVSTIFDSAKKKNRQSLDRRVSFAQNTKVHYFDLESENSFCEQRTNSMRSPLSKVASTDDENAMELTINVGKLLNNSEEQSDEEDSLLITRNVGKILKMRKCSPSVDDEDHSLDLTINNLNVFREDESLELTENFGKYLAAEHDNSMEFTSNVGRLISESSVSQITDSIIVEPELKQLFGKKTITERLQEIGIRFLDEVSLNTRRETIDRNLENENLDFSTESIRFFGTIPKLEIYAEAYSKMMRLYQENKQSVALLEDRLSLECPILDNLPLMSDSERQSVIHILKKKKIMARTKARISYLDFRIEIQQKINRTLDKNVLDLENDFSNLEIWLENSSTNQNFSSISARLGELRNIEESYSAVDSSKLIRFEKAIAEQDEQIKLFEEELQLIEDEERALQETLDKLQKDRSTLNKEIEHLENVCSTGQEISYSDYEDKKADYELLTRIFGFRIESLSENHLVLTSEDHKLTITFQPTLQLLFEGYDKSPFNEMISAKLGSLKFDSPKEAIDAATSLISRSYQLQNELESIKISVPLVVKYTDCLYVHAEFFSLESRSKFVVVFRLEDYPFGLISLTMDKKYGSISEKEMEIELSKVGTGFGRLERLCNSIRSLII